MREFILRLAYLGGLAHPAHQDHAPLAHLGDIAHPARLAHPTCPARRRGQLQG